MENLERLIKELTKTIKENSEAQTEFLKNISYRLKNIEDYLGYINSYTRKLAEANNQYSRQRTFQEPRYKSNSSTSSLGRIPRIDTNPD